MLSKVFRRFSSDLKNKLSPHQYWITQGKGMERPYTGDKWFIKELGDYYCLVCDSKVFESNHKFFSKSGLPAFWGSCPESTTVNEEDGVVCCAECKSSLGQYYDKGPLPTR